MKKRIIVICLVLLIIALCGFKIYLTKYYEIKFINPSTYADLRKGLKFRKTINIPEVKLSDEEYLSLENMKIRNDFNSFTKQDNGNDYKSVTYILYEDNKAIASFSMSISSTYIDYLKTDGVTFYNVDDKKTKLQDRKDFLKRNNIKNDLDLFAYFYNNDLPKTNVFMPISIMRSNYATYLMATTMLPKANYLTKIEGRETGYEFNLDKASEVSILKNNKRYVFLFMGKEYFTDDYLDELIKTIVIDYN